MSDLACWRCTEGYVLRIHGGEHWLTKAELAWLLDKLPKVFDDEVSEVLGKEYQELIADRATREASKPSLIAKLGLRPKPLTRRPL